MASDAAKALAKEDGLIAGLVHVLQNDAIDNTQFLGHLCRLLDLFSDNRKLCVGCLGDTEKLMTS